MVVAGVTVIFLDEPSKNIRYQDYIPLFVPLIIFNILSTAAGFFTARTLKLQHKSAFTIAIEMGLQNSMFALYIANQLLKDKDLSLIAILYGSFSLISTLGIAYLLKRYFKYEQR